MWWTKKVACSECKKNVPKDEIRADVAGTRWVCKDCYRMLREKHEPKVEVPKVIMPKEETHKFMCNQCKYTFEAKKLGRLCPFCGRANTVASVDKSLPW